MKTAAAYIRVSTNEQLDLSPDSQLKKIEEYAKAHDILLPKAYIFREEEGRSGRSAEQRVEFLRMIAAAKEKPCPFELILVWKYSRFARSREDSVVYKSMLRRECGIEVVSVSEPLSDDNSAVIMEAMIEAMDEYYSVNLSEEVRRGMAEKARRGGLVGPPAYGYLVRDGKLYPDPERRDVVKLIFQMFTAGIGYRPIATQLNSLGIRTRTGKLLDNRMVMRILSNPVYIGKICWSPEGQTAGDYNRPDLIIVEGEHEPIISPKMFQEAQVRMAELARQHRRYQQDTRADGLMLQGLVRCSNCGSTLVRTGVGMQCHGYAHGVCKVSHYITLDRINERVLDLIEADMQTGSFEVMVRQPPLPPSQQMNEQLLKKAEQRLDRVRIAYEEGIDNLEEYQYNKAKILQEIEQIRQKMAANPPIEQPDMAAVLPRYRQLVKTLLHPETNDQERNVILRSFVDHILFERKRNRLTVFYYV